MIVTLALAALACGNAGQTGSMAFSTIARGDQSGIEEPRQAVARTAPEWAALWKAHGGEGAPPAVDWGRSMVVGVFLGTRPTAGYSVEITRIEQRGGAIVVGYREHAPAPDAIVAQMLTAPFHIVQTASGPGRIRFERARDRGAVRTAGRR